MCSVVRALVLLALCVAVMARAEMGTDPITEGSTVLTGDASIERSEVPASPTEALGASPPVFTVAGTQNSTSASSFIVASTLVVSLLPALMLGY